ncbi:ParB/RepB/Spo0J family partition protein [Desulfonema magnum]|uniref:ParB/RepB/Spo0J family partition protein n=2 Tax=Desulfonema magnum TaxID=45655 RepID=A0A975BGL1_9BACT|nr:ParB/RepB/Spo0J family partition protein [Desulfonema magnum]
MKKAGEYFQCDIELIRPNRYQPRLVFSQNEIEELCQSVRNQGILQPLLIRNANSGYELIAGERRLRAAKLAGLKQIPVILKDISDTDMLVMSIVENIQRKNLNPVEEAQAYHRLMAEFNFTQEQVAEHVGKSRSAVANALRLRQLSPQIRETITDGTLSMGHAKALLSAKTSARQTEAWRAVISKGLSVRETENLIKRLNAKNKNLKNASGEDTYFSDIADDLSRHFGTKVQIKRRGQKGKLEIEFYNDDDLDRLITLLRN